MYNIHHPIKRQRLPFADWRTPSCQHSPDFALYLNSHVPHTPQVPTSGMRHCMINRILHYGWWDRLISVLPWIFQLSKHVTWDTCSVQCTVTAVTNATRHLDLVPHIEVPAYVESITSRRGVRVFYFFCCFLIFDSIFDFDFFNFWKSLNSGNSGNRKSSNISYFQ